MRRAISFEGLIWAIQALSGVALVLLISVHWVAQHLVAPGGLRDFSEVLSFVRQPRVMVLEITFLVVTTAHAALGVRAIALDIGPAAKFSRWIDAGLTLIALAVVVYGVGILRSIAG